MATGVWIFKGLTGGFRAARVKNGNISIINIQQRQKKQENKGYYYRLAASFSLRLDWSLGGGFLGGILIAK